MTVAALSRPRVLADAIPGGLVRDAVLVASGTAVIAASSLVIVPLWFTPVPLSLQTFAVLLVGAALGWKRGALSALIFLAAGMAGVGWFSEGKSGWAFASFGYIVGFVAAAALVGWLASRGGDRTVLRTAGTMVLGNLAIYAVGVTGLMLYTGMGLGQSLSLGVAPFILGDLLKIALAAGLLPAAWMLVKKVESR